MSTTLDKQIVTMFSKYVTFLAFAANAIAGAIKPGVYKITSVDSHSTARSYHAFTPVFVSSSKEHAGPYELVGLSFCLCLGIYSSTSNFSGMLETLRMVVTLSKTSAWAPLRLFLWVHSYSGHITCLTYCLFTLSLGEPFKPVLKLLHSTSNVRATANSWYVLPLFLGCWHQSNFNILSSQDQVSI